MDDGMIVCQCGDDPSVENGHWANPKTGYCHAKKANGLECMCLEYREMVPMKVDDASDV